MDLSILKGFGMTEVVSVDDSLRLSEVLRVSGKRKVQLLGHDSDNLKLLRTQIFSQIKSTGGRQVEWFEALPEALEGALQEALPDGLQAEDGACLTVSLFAGIPADVFLMFDLADRQHLNQIQADGKSALSNFKKILVPGQWMARSLLGDKRLGLKATDVLVVGAPRIDYLRSLAEQAGETGERTTPRVLFAPIHSNWFDAAGNPMSSSSGLQEYLEELGHHCELTVSEDQRNKINKRPVTRELIDADIVITDYTSVAYEAWALGKPVIFPRWILGDAILEKAPNSAEAEIYRRKLGYHPESFDALLELIVAGSKLEVSAEVKDFCREYLSNFEESNSASKICAHLEYLSDPQWEEREEKTLADIERYLKEHQWAQAESALMSLVSVYPEDASLNNKLALAYQGQHKWWQVVATLQAVVRVVRNSADIYHRLGVAEKKNGAFPLRCERL